MTIATNQADDIPSLLENLYAHATMASGDSDFQAKAYKQFCKELATLEGILKDKGLNGPQEA
jgi:hypothetical protein